MLSINIFTASSEHNNIFSGLFVLCLQFSEVGDIVLPSICLSLYSSGYSVSSWFWTFIMSVHSSFEQFGKEQGCQCRFLSIFGTIRQKTWPPQLPSWSWLKRDWDSNFQHIVTIFLLWSLVSIKSWHQISIYQQRNATIFYFISAIFKLSSPDFACKFAFAV